MYSLRGPVAGLEPIIINEDTPRPDIPRPIPAGDSPPAAIDDSDDVDDEDDDAEDDEEP